MAATYKVTLNQPTNANRGQAQLLSALVAWLVQPHQLINPARALADPQTAGLVGFVGVTSFLLAVNLLLAAL